MCVDTTQEPLVKDKNTFTNVDINKSLKIYNYIKDRINDLNIQIFEADENGEDYKYLKDELSILENIISIVNKS